MSEPMPLGVKMDEFDAKMYEGNKLWKISNVVVMKYSNGLY